MVRYTIEGIELEKIEIYPMALIIDIPRNRANLLFETVITEDSIALSLIEETRNYLLLSLSHVEATYTQFTRIVL